MTTQPEDYTSDIDQKFLTMEKLIDRVGRTNMILSRELRSAMIDLQHAVYAKVQR